MPGSGTALAAARSRRALGHVPTGVALFTAATPAGPVGTVVNSSVPLAPPLISGAARTSLSWPFVRAAGAFTVDVLGEQHAQMCRRFAQQGVDPSAGTSYQLCARAAT